MGRMSRKKPPPHTTAAEQSAALMTPAQLREKYTALQREYNRARQQLLLAESCVKSFRSAFISQREQDLDVAMAMSEELLSQP